MDLAVEINRTIQPRALPAEFHDDVLRLQAAVMDVLAQHPHEFMDSFIRETKDVSKAVYGSCGTCGNVNEQGQVWCRTVRAIAAALKIGGGDVE